MTDYTKRKSRFDEPTRFFLIQLLMDMLVAIFSTILWNNVARENYKGYNRDHS